MVELGTALRSMAADVQMSPDVDGGDLWSRGRARVRRRRVVGAGVLAALVAVVALAGVLVPTPTVVMPAGPTHEPAIPKDIFRPSRWLAGTDDRGPLGQLAVLGGADRAGGPGVFGISAATGEYRFLDLPDLATGLAVRLAPDGRHVAYWLTGTTPEAPFHLPGEPVVVGVAIYDTVSGHVARADVDSPHGLAAGDLVWLDDRTLGLDYGVRDTPHSGKDVHDRVWQVGSPGPVIAPEAADFRLYRNRNGSFLQVRAGGFVEVRRTADGRPVDPGPVLRLPEVMSLRYADGMSGYSQVSRSGRLVTAVLEGAVGVSNPLLTGVVGPDGRVPRLDTVEGLQNVEVLGWRDDDTLLVLGSLGGGSASLVEVDVRTRQVRRVGDAKPMYVHTGLAVATDLVDQPMVAGLRPPDPIDPRWRSAGIAAALAALGGLALVLVRRRRLRA